MSKKKTKNTNMIEAKRNKNDEFYTQLTDIEKEMLHYWPHFEDKVVYLNCDDPEHSNFFRYFAWGFDHLKLKKLIATHYNPDGVAYKIEITEQLTPGLNGESEEDISLYKVPLEGDGDFRSDESIELLKESDIVVTNPPFSLFREFVAQLIEHNKKFLIIGNQNALTYKEIFPLIKDNKVWLGTGSNLSLVFETPYGNELEANRTFVRQKGYDPDNFIKVPAVCWFTNLEHKKRNEEIVLFRSYYENPEKYPKYDNYDIINVNRVADIPEDYEGIMGVPITFIDKFNPNQFEIKGSRRWDKDQDVLDLYTGSKDSAELDFKTTINGKETYDRIFVSRKWKTKESLKKRRNDLNGNN